MTISKKRKYNPNVPKHGHEIEFNKKGRHPFKRRAKFINNIEDDEDEMGLIDSGSRRYSEDYDEES